MTTEAEVEDLHHRRPHPPGNATGRVRGHAIETGEVEVTEEVEVEVVRLGIMKVVGPATIDVGPTRGRVVEDGRGPSREAKLVPVPIAGTDRLK